VSSTGPVHLAGVVLEDAQVGDLVREVVRVRFRVLPAHPEQDEQAGSDRGDELAAHAHRRFRDSLHDGSHQGNPAAVIAGLALESLEDLAQVFADVFGALEHQLLGIAATEAHARSRPASRG
jgi:hypothetical protein